MKYPASLLLLLTLALSSSLTLSACAHSPTEESVDDARNLQMCVQAFHKDMRWRRWESAAMRIVPEHRQAFWAATTSWATTSTSPTWRSNR